MVVIAPDCSPDVGSMGGSGSRWVNAISTADFFLFFVFFFEETSVPLNLAVYGWVASGCAHAKGQI